MRVTVLTGGVGGARFLRGLSALRDPATLTVIANTADDDEFFGLHVSPDLDTALYTLAGRVDRTQGWGIAGDTVACLEALVGLGARAWFRLGDRDLATHVRRTDWLRRGVPLSTVTRRLVAAHGLSLRLLPMTDARVRTVVHTPAGALPFQAYLVRDRARHRVRRITFTGARRARPAPGVLAALRSAAVVIIAPSNPLVSIGPILAIPGVRQALRRRRGPTVAISPLVGGRAVRGPLHRMLRGLGLAPHPRTVARLYRGLIDTFVVDHRDAAAARVLEAEGLRVVVTETIMSTPGRSRRLAATILHALERPALR
jgi:LPPG:FO 2-phospho-L-lactate transferase